MPKDLKKYKIAMIGPFPGKNMGPAVRNALIRKGFEDRGHTILTANTNDSSFLFFRNLLSSIYNSKYVYASFSRNGLLYLYPILFLLIWISRKNRNFILYPAGGSFYELINKMPKIIRILYVKSILSTKKLIVQTYGMKVKLEKFFPGAFVLVLPNPKPYRVNSPTAFPPERTSKFRFLYLSRIKREKGIETLFEASKKINEKTEKNICIDLYGVLLSDYEPTFTSLLKENPSITYRGALPPNKELLTTISSYYAMIFPSEWSNEGFPGVLADASLAGLPIIASDNAYNDEIIEDNINGLIFETGNSEDLAEKIIKMTEQIEERNKMAINSFNRSELYTMDSFVIKLQESLLND